MNTVWPSGEGRLKRGALAAAALGLASAAALAGAGQAAASARGGPGSGPATAGRIFTVAGGVGGPARATSVALSDLVTAFVAIPRWRNPGYPYKQFTGPCGVSAAAGHIYIANGGLVREVSQRTDLLTTPAGDDQSMPFVNGGPASRAALATCGAALDHAGNLVIADALYHRIRVVAARTGTFYGRPMTGGHIYTVAGTGKRGDSGNGGPATKARLSNPADVVVDAAGNLVFADTSNTRICVVAARTGTFYGLPMTAGNLYRVAGTGQRGFSGDGGPATKASLGFPEGVAIDPAGNLTIADTYDQRVRVVASATGTFYGQAMTAGDIYTVAGTGTRGFSGDGGPATSASLKYPTGVTVDTAGNLVIADTRNQRIRVVAAATGTFYGQAMTAGDIYTVAGHLRHQSFSGDGGPATSAGLSVPTAVAMDAAGNLVIADTGNYRIRVVAAASGTFYGQPMTAGDIYTVAGDSNLHSSGDGGPATRAELYAPQGVATDAAGNLLIADRNAERVRVAAHRSGTFYGQPMRAGDIYTVAGNGIRGFSGDGGPATSAELDGPWSAVVDHAGNLVITDLFNNRIRVVAARSGTFYGQAMTAGDIYTVAGNGIAGFSGDGGPATSAELDEPAGTAVDAAGNLVIADRVNQRIRVVAARTGRFYGRPMTAGDIYRIAGNGTRGFAGDGGPATSAELDYPAAVTPDAAGNLVISDNGNGRVRVVAASTGTFYGQAMTAGDIYTVAGNGTSGPPALGGPATGTGLSDPEDVSPDAAGNLLIADGADQLVLVVATHTGTFYGQSMTAGDLYAVAGNGTQGFSGDGGQATSAELSLPQSVAVDQAGDLLIADTGNARVREVRA